MIKAVYISQEKDWVYKSVLCITLTGKYLNHLFVTQVVNEELVSQRLVKECWYFPLVALYCGVLFNGKVRIDIQAKCCHIPGPGNNFSQS